jgi:glycopeptide antibiotics resistance protein
MHFDFGYITKYMLKYDSGVPISVFILDAVCVCVGILVLYRNRSDKHIFLRQFFFCLLLGYVFLVLCSTILFRDSTPDMKCYLLPFGSLSRLDNRTLAQNLLNIILFIPIGFLVGGAFKRKHLLKAIGVGWVLSLSIEIVQLITGRGVCNIDDVIHNTMGCIIGFVGFVYCYKLISCTN